MELIPKNRLSTNPKKKNVFFSLHRCLGLLLYNIDKGWFLVLEKKGHADRGRFLVLEKKGHIYSERRQSDGTVPQFSARYLRNAAELAPRAGRRINSDTDLRAFD